MKPTIIKVVKTVTQVTAVITADNIRSAFDLPADAKISFDVPGGGDWSNTRLGIDEYPLTAEWKE